MSNEVKFSNHLGYLSDKAVVGMHLYQLFALVIGKAKSDTETYLCVDRGNEVFLCVVFPAPVAITNESSHSSIRLNELCQSELYKILKDTARAGGWVPVAASSPAYCQGKQLLKMSFEPLTRFGEKERQEISIIFLPLVEPTRGVERTACTNLYRRLADQIPKPANNSPIAVEEFVRIQELVDYASGLYQA